METRPGTFGWSWITRFTFFSVTSLMASYLFDCFLCPWFENTFKEFGRILKPQRLVLFFHRTSVFGYTYFGLENYFITQAVSGTWTSFDQRWICPVTFTASPISRIVCWRMDLKLKNPGTSPTKDFKGESTRICKADEFSFLYSFQSKRKKNHQKAFS